MEPVQATWVTLIAAVLSGGLIVKLLDVLHAEVRRRLDTNKDAREFVSEHLDPILKSADEVVGKIRAYAERDFKALEDLKAADYSETLESVELSGFIYLIANFWARLEFFRREGLTYAIGRDRRGKRLSKFLSALESRGGRLVDRTTQRAIGEALISENGREVMTFVEFVKRYETDAAVRRWVFPLVTLLCETGDKRRRQQVLKVGSILHAMVDTLDRAHHVTRSRPPFANKLSPLTQRDLKHRVFPLHLSFVPEPEKYFAPRKKVDGPQGPKPSWEILWAAFRRIRPKRTKPA